MILKRTSSSRHCGFCGYLKKTNHEQTFFFFCVWKKSCGGGYKEINPQIFMSVEKRRKTIETFSCLSHSKNKYKQSNSTDSFSFGSTYVFKSPFF